MKILRNLITLVAAIGLAALARAESAVVTTLNTSTVKAVITVGYGVQNIYFANATAANGGAQVNIAIDGGAANGGTDPTTGASGKGLWLPAGAYFILPAANFRGKTISAIMATGTTNLSISTEAPAGTSTFPTA